MCGLKCVFQSEGVSSITIANWRYICDIVDTEYQFRNYLFINEKKIKIDVTQFFPCEILLEFDFEKPIHCTQWNTDDEKLNVN